MDFPTRFIDAHHHLWIPESTRPDLGYGWLRDIGAMKPFGDPTPIQRNYEWEEYAAESDMSALAGSVYLQCDGAIADPVAETAWVQSVFEQSPLLHGIVGLVDLSQPGAEASVLAQKHYPLFRGVRQILSRHDDRPELCFASRHFLHDARWRDQFVLLREHRLSFDLQLYPEQMASAAEFLARFPDVPVIIDHAGSPYDQSAAGLKRWASGLKQLAALDAVSIKLCGFGMFDPLRQVQSIRPLVEEALELFGAGRVMYASNFPVDKLMGSFDESLGMLCQCLEGCDDAQREAIFVGNARRIYRLQ